MDFDLVRISMITNRKNSLVGNMQNSLPIRHDNFLVVFYATRWTKSPVLIFLGFAMPIFQYCRWPLKVWQPPTQLQVPWHAWLRNYCKKYLTAQTEVECTCSAMECTLRYTCSIRCQSLAVYLQPTVFIRTVLPIYSTSIWMGIMDATFIHISSV